MTGFTHRRKRRTTRRGGFTLLETALAIVIVGTGVLAIVGAQQAFHQQNNWSTHASIAERLGNEIREATLNLPRHDPVTGLTFDPVTGDLSAGWGSESNESNLVENFDDLDDYDGDGGGIIFTADWDDQTEDNGPINARREVIPDMEGWSQIVTVRNVDPFDINVVEEDGTTTMIMVEVIVTYQGPRDAEPMEVTRVSWIAPN
jgi:type II secretory pathway pseudopilin PulG